MPSLVNTKARYGNDFIIIAILEILQKLLATDMLTNHELLTELSKVSFLGLVEAKRNKDI